MFDSVRSLATNHSGLLVVGHGTRLAAGQLQLKELVDGMQKLCPETPMQACFLELAEPDIKAGLQLLAAQSVRSVIVVPVLLFTAAHALQDIPDAVTEAAHELGIHVLGQSDSLNHHPATLALSQLRAFQAMLCTNKTGCNEAAFCDRALQCFDRSKLDIVATMLEPLQSTFRALDENCAAASASANAAYKDVALVMIGRGTSEPSAREAMREFCRIRSRAYPTSWSCVGFFAGDEVGITSALYLAGEQVVSNTVLVQPHLLFEGQLTQQLRNAIDECRERFPEKRWICAMPLGGDELLSRTYLSLADEVASRHLHLS